MSYLFDGEQAEQPKQLVALGPGHSSLLSCAGTDRAEGLPFEGEYDWDEWIDLGGEG